MKNFKKKLAYLLILILVIATAFFIGMTKAKNDLKPTITSSLIANKLEEARELTTLKYQYTNMGQFENQNTFYGYKIPFTGKKFILTYDGVIHAGVHLEDLEIEVKGKSIHIHLPPAQILSHEIDEDSLQVYDEKNSIFNPIKVEDYANFSKDQKGKMEERAIRHGLLTEAQNEAQKAIVDILNVDTFLQDYKITVDSQ